MSRRALWIIGGAVAVIVITAVLVWLLLPRADPETQSLAYLQALSDGDVAAVEATGIDVSEAAATVFADASEHLTEGAIESVTTADNRTADVVVSFELAGASHKSTLTLSQQEGRWMLVAASALGSLQYAVPTSIADTPLPPGSVELLPAVYGVSAAPEAFFDGRATVEVLPGSTQEIAIDAILRPEAADAAQTELDDYLATCTTSAAEVPPSCGIAIPWAADFAAVSEIRYRIEQTPTISLTSSTFQADEGIIVATVAGTALDGSSKTLTYRSTNWSVRGDVDFTADDIVLSVW